MVSFPIQARTAAEDIAAFGLDTVVAPSLEATVERRTLSVAAAVADEQQQRLET